MIKIRLQNLLDFIEILKSYRDYYVEVTEN